eukprot:6507776-Pyramimonas_sp.AAC.1
MGPRRSPHADQCPAGGQFHQLNPGFRVQSPSAQSGQQGSTLPRMLEGVRAQRPTCHCGY